MLLNSAIVEYRKAHFPKLKPKTREGYKSLINVWIVPALGLRELRSITKADICRLHCSMARYPYQANRTLALLSGLFSHYKISPNPAKEIRRYNERTRETYLTPDEVHTLSKALGKHPDRPFANAMLLLILTGARKRDILDAEWRDLNWSTKQLLIHDSKTGKKYIVLNDFAMKVLEAIYSPISPYIIPGPDPRKPRSNIDKPWQILRKKINMRHVRIHDLRHTFASYIANGPKANLFVLRDLLHHSSVVTTQRYAHLFDKSLREASNQVGNDLINLGLEHIVGKENPPKEDS